MSATKSIRRLIISTNALILALLIGQFLAFVREVVIAAHFGATSATDAYFVAFSIPDLFLQLSLSGAAVSAMIPLIATHVHKHGEDAQWQVSGPLLLFYVLLSVVAIGAGWLLMPLLVRILAPGFALETARATVELGRMMLPAILFVTLAAAVTGLMNYRGRFFVPALRFGIQSLFVILFVYLLGAKLGVLSAAIGVVVGAAVSLLALLPNAHVKEMRRHFPALRGQATILKQYFRLALPIMLTGALIQVSLFAEKIAASYLVAGSVAALVLARKISFFAIAIGSQSFLTVVYPDLAMAATEQNTVKFRKHFRFALVVTIVVMGAVAVLMWGFAEPITRVLLQRGMFDAEATQKVSKALGWFALGVPIFSVNALLTRVYHARKLVLPPLLIGVASLVPYVFLLVLLTKWLGLGGIVLALVIAECLRLILLSAAMKGLTRRD